jgi:hypothetical protein
MTMQIKGKPGAVLKSFNRNTARFFAQCLTLLAYKVLFI